MDNTIPVHIGGLVVSDSPVANLIAVGLGATVAVCAFDPLTGVGGMLHAILPLNPHNSSAPEKFVSSGIPELLEKLISAGAFPEKLIWRYSGGAQLLAITNRSGALDIGRQNLVAVQETGARLGITLIPCGAGGHVNRAAILHMQDGCLVIRDANGRERRYDVSYRPGDIDMVVQGGTL